MAKDKCANCEYHGQALINETGQIAHSCNYLSRVTAWECIKDKEGYKKGAAKK